MSFVYRVKYTDAENDPPAYIKLYIANNGTAISGSPFSMTAENPNNTNYIAGNIYTFSTTLPESNNYTYSIRTLSFPTIETEVITSTITGPVSLKPDISGYVKDPAGNGMQNVAVGLTGTETRTLYTDINGYYDFVDLTYSGNYTITPSSFIIIILHRDLIITVFYNQIVIKTTQEIILLLLYHGLPKQDMSTMGKTRCGNFYYSIYISHKIYRFRQ